MRRICLDIELDIRHIHTIKTNIHTYIDTYVQIYTRTQAFICMYVCMYELGFANNNFDMI